MRATATGLRAVLLEPRALAGGSIPGRGYVPARQRAGRVVYREVRHLRGRRLCLPVEGHTRQGRGVGRDVEGERARPRSHPEHRATPGAAGSDRAGLVASSAGGRLDEVTAVAADLAAR